jgi:hypothetical protein
MKTIMTRAFLGFALLNAACNGSGSDPANSATPPAPVNQLPGGLWYGTITSDTAMGAEDVIAMVSEDGEFRIITISLLQMSGILTVSGASATGDGRAFASPGGTWPDGSTVGDVEIAATVDERDTMSGAYSTSTNESGTFDLLYDPLYERDSSLGLLTGMWTAYDDFGNPDVTFSVQGGGSFDGQNALGCTSAGQFSIIDARFDLYAVQSTVSGCAIAGDYSGLAVVADLIAPNDTMIFAVDNGTTAVLLGLLGSPGIENGT